MGLLEHADYPAPAVEGALEKLVRKSLASESAEFQRWAATQTAAKYSHLLSARIADCLSKRNINDAGAWLNTLPAGRARDAGVIELVSTLVAADQKSEAQVWSRTIQSVEVRKQAEETISTGSQFR